MCISSNDIEQVVNAKQRLDTITVQARKENICNEISESVVHLSMENARMNMKKLAESHGVQVVRV